VTRLLLAPQVLADTARFADHLRLHEVADVDARIDEIFDALDLLVVHPMIGRRTDDGMRELVIGHGSRGYLARYRFDAASDTVHVLALRAQRESGFSDD
jgi:toxin ParE1/3/4